LEGFVARLNINLDIKRSEKLLSKWRATDLEGWSEVIKKDNRLTPPFSG
jgi:hypothetical protein